MTPKTKISEKLVPEVERFIEAQERVQRLKDAYPEVFEQLDKLAEEYNASLEAADKACRSAKISCGPFVLYQTSTKYNVEKLYEELGRERFLEVGGSTKTVTVYEVDKARLEAHIAANSIPKAVLNEVREISPRYKKPEKIVI